MIVDENRRAQQILPGVTTAHGKSTTVSLGRHLLSVGQLALKEPVTPNSTNSRLVLADRPTQPSVAAAIANGAERSRPLAASDGFYGRVSPINNSTDRQFLGPI